MTTFSLSAHKDYPVDAEVGAYPDWSFRRGSSPASAPVDTQMMTTDGLTFTGLQPGGRYLAYAEVEGEHRYRFFTAPEGMTDDELAALEAAGVGRELYRFERDGTVSGTGVAGAIHSSGEIALPRFVRVTIVAPLWECERDDIDTYGYIACTLYQGAPDFENERIMAVRRVSEDEPVNTGPLYAAGVFDLGAPGEYNVLDQIEPGGAGQLATNQLTDADDLDGNDRESGIQVIVESAPVAS